MRTNDWWKLAALVLLAAGSMPGAGFESCPSQVAVQPQRIAKPISGWSVISSEEPHQLTSIAFYDGDPKENASLAPDQAGRQRQVWTLAAQSRPYWLSCHYSGTTVVLARPLPAAVRQCVVTYEPSVTLEGMPQIKEISCK